MMIGFYVGKRRRAVYVPIKRDAWLTYQNEIIVPKAVRRALKDGHAFREVIAYGREGSKLVIHLA